MLKIQSSLFLKELLLFGATLALGLFIAYRYLFLLSAAELVQPSSITMYDILVFIVVLSLVFVASRIPRLGSWIFWIFLSLVILSGTQVAIAAVVPFPWDILGSLVLLTLFLFVRNVLMHDIVIICAIAGIGALIGMMITPTVAIFAFILLSFYDIIAVYKTRHMVHMAEGMIRSGAIFGFIIPSEFKLFGASRQEAQSRIGNEFMILGSGDIGLPLIFASSLMRQSLPQAIIVAGFALLGLLLTHVLFISQSKRQAMAALPPIATMAILGYLLALFII